MNILNFIQRRAALEALPERDKKILKLLRKVSDSLIFASQNAHSEIIQMKYERAAQSAMTELEDFLLSETRKDQTREKHEVSAGG